MTTTSFTIPPPGVVLPDPSELDRVNVDETLVDYIRRLTVQTGKAIDKRKADTQPKDSRLWVSPEGNVYSASINSYGAMVITPLKTPYTPPVIPPPSPYVPTIVENYLASNVTLSSTTVYTTINSLTLPNDGSSWLVDAAIQVRDNVSASAALYGAFIQVGSTVIGSSKFLNAAPFYWTLIEFHDIPLLAPAATVTMKAINFTSTSAVVQGDISSTDHRTYLRARKLTA